MRILQTLILCLCTLSVYSQTKKDNPTNETYLFEKATFTVYNYNSKAVVNTRVITDLASMTTEDMFYQNTFGRVIINNGSLLYCTLPDQKEYAVKDDGVKIFPIKTQSFLKDEKKESVSSGRPFSGQLEPYLMSLDNGVLTFTVNYVYGDSQYSFPLEGKLVLTMTKQK